MKIFCGIDWASDHHDVALVDADGTLVARARITDDAAGLQQLLDLLAEHGDTPETRIPAAIETSRGLLVACLRATGRPVYAINPMAASRYRDRHTVARKKSDHFDAMVLANILRTDTAAHRTLPADTELAQAIAVLARAQQDAVWDRTQAANKLRSHLREYFPGYLAAVRPILGGLCSSAARVLLAAASTPGPGRPADQDPAAGRTEKSWTPTRDRRGGGGGGGGPRSHAFKRSYEPLKCANFHWSRTRWAARPRHCSESWTPHAPAQMNSPKPRWMPLRHTRTPTSSPASPDSAPSPAPACLPRLETTDPASPMPEPSSPTPEQHR